MNVLNTSIKKIKCIHSVHTVGYVSSDRILNNLEKDFYYPSGIHIIYRYCLPILHNFYKLKSFPD